MAEEEGTGKSSRWKCFAIALFLTTLAVIQFIPGPAGQSLPPAQSEAEMGSKTSPTEPDTAVESNGEDTH